MPQETQAETFIRILTQLWNEDREQKECHQELRLKADVRRFVRAFHIETGRGRFTQVPPKAGIGRGRVAERPVAAE